MENIDNAFVAGDVVQLKSGSPAMTVTAIIQHRVNVKYFEEHTQSFKTLGFDAILLEKVQKDK